MFCHYCGKLLSVTSMVFSDEDFCTPKHRRLFHERLRNVLLQVQETTPSRAPVLLPPPTKPKLPAARIPELRAILAETRACLERLQGA